MISFNPTQNYSLIKSILFDPRLWTQTYGQCDEGKDQFEVDKDFTYFIIKEDNTVLGIFKIRAMTKVLVEIHSLLLSRFWGTGSSERASRAFIDYLAEHTDYKQAFTFVPESCPYVIKFLQEMGANNCGMVPNGIVYDGLFTNLYFFNYPIARIN